MEASIKSMENRLTSLEKLITEPVIDAITLAEYRDKLDSLEVGSDKKFSNIEQKVAEIELIQDQMQEIPARISNVERQVYRKLSSEGRRSNRAASWIA